MLVFAECCLSPQYLCVCVCVCDCMGVSDANLVIVYNKKDSSFPKSLELPTHHFDTYNLVCRWLQKKRIGWIWR